MGQFTKIALATIIIALMLPSSALATGPRVTISLFSPEKNEIHTVDFPPFISTEVNDSGVASEIVHAALISAKIEARITTHPVKRMVRYYLLQEKAMAVIERHIKLTAEEKKHLIFIPVMVVAEKYYYYKPAHPNGFSLSNSNLHNLTYGSHRGEDVSRYEQAGMTIKYGRTMSLLRKLKRGKVDFIAAPSLTVEWLLNRYMSDEKENFVSMADQAGNDILYIIFNRKHEQGEASAKRFNKALSDMVEDGRYGKIIEKHLGNGTTVKSFLRRLETFH